MCLMIMCIGVEMFIYVECNIVISIQMEHNCVR